MPSKSINLNYGSNTNLNTNPIINHNNNFQQYKASTPLNNIPVSENNYNYVPTTHSHLLNSPSNMDDSNTSRNEVKTFLNEVREKIPSSEFKEFIKFIKVLTDKSNINLNRREIFENVKSLFGNKYRDLYMKFEMLLSVKK